jgi:hypothetical protein
MAQLHAGFITNTYRFDNAIRLDAPAGWCFAAVRTTPPGVTLMSEEQTIYVLNPSAALPGDITSPGPVAGNLAGKTVGFRQDILWRSCDWFSEIWAEEPRAAGAKVVFWRAQGRTGPEGERMAQEMKAFYESIDVAIVGLGNCGSCTGWTIHDALASAKAGLPTIAILTANFEELGRNLARRGGRSGLRTYTLPYPLNEQYKDSVRDVAMAHYHGMLAALGATADVRQKAVA